MSALAPLVGAKRNIDEHLSAADVQQMIDDARARSRTATPTNWAVIEKFPPAREFQAPQHSKGVLRVIGTSGRGFVYFSPWVPVGGGIELVGVAIASHARIGRRQAGPLPALPHSTHPAPLRMARCCPCASQTARRCEKRPQNGAIRALSRCLVLSGWVDNVVGDRRDIDRRRRLLRPVVDDYHQAWRLLMLATRPHLRLLGDVLQRAHGADDGHAVL
jgi:hypothetical protein